MASNLSKKVQEIENSIALIGVLYDRLCYLQPTTNALMEGTAGMEQFAQTGYLLHCRNQMRRGTPFPEAWKSGVEEYAKILGSAHADALLPLGDVLGSTELDGQLAALKYTRELLENRLEEARRHRDQHGKLYQSLGVLSGIAIVIILI